MARPTKLTPELLELAVGYVTPKADGKEVGYQKHGDVIPTIEGFAQYVGISRDTVYAWERENPEFSDIADSVRQLQGRMALNGGLKGTFNATISKLLLSSKHGYVEQSATDVTSKGEKLEPSTSVDGSAVDAFVKHIKHDTSAVQTSTD